VSRPIDVHFAGVDRLICAWEVDGAIVDPGPASSLETLLAALEEPPRALLLTHIHLDHAGAGGGGGRHLP
jgi:glyoxylase-like metal-dependent hydrolase (beta-lactamase superfamily II)